MAEASSKNSRLLSRWPSFSRKAHKIYARNERCTDLKNFCTKNAHLLELVVGLETLLLHHGRDLIVAERREINALLLAAIVVKDEKIRVRALNPADVNVFVQLESLLVLQPPSYIVELVQLSAGARLEAALRALGRHKATLLQDAAAVLAVPILAVLRRAGGLCGGQRRQSQEWHPHC